MRSIQDTKQEQYIKFLFAQEDKPLAEIVSSMREDEAHMQVSPVEGKILHMLVKMIGARNILEIGTLAGYSAIWMARAIPENGRLYTIETDYKKEGRIRNNIRACGVEEKVELIIGKALDVLPDMSRHAPFDMVFIDADKANYLNYLDWAEKNVRQGGLIVGDNTFLFGAVYGDNAISVPEETIKIMQKFNTRLADSDRYTSIILPTCEGMTVALICNPTGS